MRFNREFFGSSSSKSKLLDAETRALEFGHFPVLFLAERFEVASSSEMKPQPDFYNCPDWLEGAGKRRPRIIHLGLRGDRCRHMTPKRGVRGGVEVEG